MQQNFNQTRKIKRFVLLGLLLSGLFIKANCFLGASFIDPHPTTVEANKNFTVKFLVNITNGGLGAAANKKLVVALLVPKSWKTASNAVVKYSSDLGGGTMRLIPDNVLIGDNDPAGTLAAPYPAKLKQIHGICNNVVDAHEWVAYMSDEGYDINQGQKVDATITVSMKAGGDNLLTKLGYLISFDGDATSSPESHKLLISDCVEVLNGTGDLEDYCNKPLSAITPVLGSDNDYFRIVYDNDLVTSAINGKDSLYIWIDKAYCTNGDILTRTNRDDKSKLRELDNNIFTKIIWPRGLLQMRDGQSLERIEYFIADKQGNKAGLRGSATEPLIFRFKCN